MKREDALAKLSPLHHYLKTKYGVTSLFLFGSVARNEATDQSDIDLLVEFEQPIGLFEFIGLQQNLESVLGCKVDLGTKRSLKLPVLDNILKRQFVSPRNWQDRIQDILNCATNITSFTNNITFESFIDDPKTIRAVAFELTTIGEAAKAIPVEIQEKYKEIPWGKFKEFEIYWFMSIFDWTKKSFGRLPEKIFRCSRKV